MSVDGVGIKPAGANSADTMVCEEEEGEKVMVSDAKSHDSLCAVGLDF